MPLIDKENHNNEITETPLDKVEIKNSEVKELYKYVEANIHSNYVCLGYFYQNPFENHTLKDKVSLVLMNYGYNKYEKEIDDEFLKKISPSDREHIKVNRVCYIDADIIKNGMKIIFNIDISNFEETNYYNWEYRKDVDAFLLVGGGGTYPAFLVQQIIEYNELDNEINLIVAKAEIDDDNIYRYVNNQDSLVYENYNGDFKFTKENVNKFPQLKYVFKKNENGNYYVSDIINLNFEEDFENCSY